MTPTPRPIDLKFDRKKHKGSKDFHVNISAVEQAGDHLWLASDELTTLERLTRTGDDSFGRHRVFALADYLSLPAGTDEEVDIEGLAIDGHYLWLTGSHSLKRESVDDAKSSKKGIKALAHMVRETNRYLLARIPLVTNPDTGATELWKTCVDPEHPKRRLTSAQLFGTGRSDMLVDALRDDPHIGVFLGVPCKENGLDVEGLAVDGNRVFLGLRGPVLSGWSIVLEIEVEPVADHLLTLKRIGPHGAYYHKHFLDLNGLGVRELCRDGNDLLVLAGPTMDLDGEILVLRWTDAMKTRKQRMVDREDLEEVLRFRFDPESDAASKHAEGITLYRNGGPDRSLLVTYDSLSRKALKGSGRILADVFPLD